MLRLSILYMLLAITLAQNGYEYNKPDRPFDSTSSRPYSPGSSFGTTTQNPLRPQGNDNRLRPQSDDNRVPTTGYPTRPLNYPQSSQRSGFPSSSYPNQGKYPSGPGSSSTGPVGPGSYDSNYPQGPRGPSGDFPDQGSRYPGQDQNYPGQSRPNSGNSGFKDDTGNYPGGDNSAIPGKPYIDYPIFSDIPQTSFDCKAQKYPGYFSDVETRCQVFHVCANNRVYDFLCPNGTVFSQEHFVCVWWNEFDCASAPSLYELNAKLYDYSKTGSNDYSGSYYSGGNGPQGPPYQGSGNSRPNENYPGNFRPQGPTTPFPSTSPFSYPGQDSRYPDSQGPFGNSPFNSGPQRPSGINQSPQRPPDRYPDSQGPLGSYPGSQGPSSNLPGYQGPGSYSSTPQGQTGGPGRKSTPYPSSTTPYPGKGSGNQGYSSGRPNRPGYPGGNGVRQPVKPNREYLPPRNKRTKQSAK